MNLAKIRCDTCDRGILVAVETGVIEVTIEFEDFSGVCGGCKLSFRAPVPELRSRFGDEQ